MTRFERRLEDRDLEELLGDILGHLDAVEEESLDPERRWVPARLRRVTRYLERKLDRVDPFLLTDELPGRLEEDLRAIRDHLAEFHGDGRASELDEADRRADRLLDVIARLEVPLHGEDVEGLKDDVVSFRRSAAQHLRFYRESVEEALEELKSVRERYDRAIHQLEEGEAEGTLATRLEALEARLGTLEADEIPRRDAEATADEPLTPGEVRRIRALLDRVETLRRLLDVAVERARKSWPRCRRVTRSFLRRLGRRAGRILEGFRGSLRRFFGSG